MSPKPLLASILMKQQTLTAFEKYGKTPRRAQFLAEMEQVVPWTQLHSPRRESDYTRTTESNRKSRY